MSGVGWRRRELPEAVRMKAGDSGSSRGETEEEMGDRVEGRAGKGWGAGR